MNNVLRKFLFIFFVINITILYSQSVQRNLVVLEIFTATWCEPCQGSSLGAHDLIEKGYDLAVIKYHYKDDYENIYGENRRKFYANVYSFPTAYFDGEKNDVGGSIDESMFNYYLPSYNKSIGVKSAFEVSLDVTNKIDNTYKISINTKQHDIITNNNINLYLALTESNIPKNWFNQTEVDNVTRSIFPDTNGIKLTPEVGPSITHTFDVLLESTWKKENCELVAFIQDVDTKKILQAAKIPLDKSTTAIDIKDKEIISSYNLSQNYPNPFNPSTKIKYDVLKSGFLSIKLYDILGNEVSTLINEFHQPGSFEVNFNAKDLASGIYYYQMRINGDSLINKMLLLK